MFRLTLGLLTTLCSLFASASINRQAVTLDSSKLKIESGINQNGHNFSKLTVEGFENDRMLGAPALPVKSILLQGRPGDIQVSLKTVSTELIEKIMPYPVQEQDCRCEVKKPKPFHFKEQYYRSPRPSYSLSYLGAFRGTPVTRLDIQMASYDGVKDQVTLKTAVELSSNASQFSFTAGNYKDYLIVAPAKLASGVDEFVTYKKSQGFNVHVEVLHSPSNDLAALTKLIRKYYDDVGVDFVILVGDDRTIPMFRVSTSDGSTPSDLKHFTMDGEGDYIPDVFYSRIVATTPEQVSSQLNKAIEFEQKRVENLSGFKKIIGIASNEGYNPSDDEYVQSIREKFEASLGVQSLHLNQNDYTNSTPAVLNKNLNQGAFWLTYLGHGSGTSWPSMAQSYSISNIKQLNNRPVVKPILIDVACMNGRIDTSYLGASFMKTETTAQNTNPFGAAAYYGGTVNISWHPPAVMARGIVFEHLDKKFKHLGEALLAGQLYLAGEWSSSSEVIDNFEWYHLQGDPGMSIEFN